MIYADTSFVVALYLDEVHSRRADAIRNATREAGWFTPLHRVEWEHVLMRRLRVGELPATAIEAMQRALEEDCGEGRWEETDWPAGLAERAVGLAREFGRRTAMRTLDTLHVAAAIELGSREFWTFDGEQGRLAGLAGLRVDGFSASGG